MNALVDPLPFVPAMWMGFIRSKSEGYGVVGKPSLANLLLGERTPHTLFYGTTRLFRGLLVHSHFRLTSEKHQLRQSWSGGC